MISEFAILLNWLRKMRIKVFTSPFGLFCSVLTNSSPYSGSGGSTLWKHMCLTFDWCLYQIDSKLSYDKPYVVMKIDDSWQIRRLQWSKFKAEILQEGAEGWRLTTGRITKSVVRIDQFLVKDHYTNLDKTLWIASKDDSNAGTSVNHDDPFQSRIFIIKVIVQIWLLDPALRGSSISEDHEFIISNNCQYQEDTHIPPDFPPGTTSLHLNVYDIAAERT